MSETDTAYAGFWRRLQAWIVDSVLVMICACTIAIVVGFILALTLGLVIEDKPTANTIYSLTGSLIGISVYCAYFVGFEVSHLQATPGKILFGLKVTDIDHQRIGVLRAFGRLVGKCLSGFLLCIGYMICGFTAKKQTLHDIMANTLVIQKSNSES